MEFEVAVAILCKHASGELPHKYRGLCPDNEDHMIRDSECSVCSALETVENNMHSDVMLKYQDSPVVDSSLFSRFSLEDGIMDIWSSIDDLNHVAEAVTDTCDEDEILNMLIGIQALLNTKVQKVYDQFESGLKTGKIS